jgi:hypothetical protein
VWLCLLADRCGSTCQATVAVRLCGCRLHCSSKHRMYVSCGFLVTTHRKVPCFSVLRKCLGIPASSRLLCRQLGRWAGSAAELDARVACRHWMLLFMHVLSIQVAGMRAVVCCAVVTRCWCHVIHVFKRLAVRIVTMINCLLKRVGFPCTPQPLRPLVSLLLSLTLLLRQHPNQQQHQLDCKRLR